MLSDTRNPARFSLSSSFQCHRRGRDTDPAADVPRYAQIKRDAHQINRGSSSVNLIESTERVLMSVFRAGEDGTPYPLVELPVE